MSWTFSSFTTAGLPRRLLPLAVVGGSLLALAGLTVLWLIIVGGSPVFIGAAVSVIGFGIGTSNLHLTAATMAAARAGEETLTASSIPTVRSLGIALGSAFAGLIANNAGLARGVSPETVASAATWVLGTAIVAPVVMLLAGSRFLQLSRRHAATVSNPS